MAFEYTTKSGRLTVVEGGDGFYVTANASGETRGLGDGVDMFFDQEENPIYVGTPEFYEVLRQDVERSEAIYLEACFGVIE